MMDWLRVPALFGLARGWLLLAVAVAAGATALTLWLTAAEKADDLGNQQLGAAVQRANDLQVTLDRTEEAHAARAEIRDTRDTARYDQCLRTARTPGNCQRFLPTSAADQR